MAKPATTAAKPYFVYIVRCSDDTYYTGIARNVEQRIVQHNTSSKAAKYTRARRPVTLLGTKQVANRSQALQLEAYIKKQPKHKKIDSLA